MADRPGVLPVFFVLTWLTGLSLAAAFAIAVSEPERTDLISLAIFGVMGLASQAGLLLAPWAVTRGSAPRIVAALLMAPSGIFLSIFAYEGFTRYAAGSPMWAMAWSNVAGVLVYAVAYVALVRGRFGRRVQGGRG